jgi:putative membrane protein (TIGR04086 family)
MGMEPNVKASRKSIVGDILKGALKGTLISMVFTVAVILLFALIIKETGLSDSVIAPVNQVLKILGIIGASWFAIKGMMEKQWLTGGIAGLLFISLSYLVFSLIEGIFGNVALLFSDMLMGLLIGMVFSIIVANFGKSSRTRVKTQKSKRIQFKKARV